VRLQIAEDKETPTAKDIEARIYAVRQVYAASFLLQKGEIKRVGWLGNNIELSADPTGRNTPLTMNGPDLEVLLNEKDRSYITSAYDGSFWLALAVKSRAAFKTLLWALCFIKKVEMLCLSAFAPRLI
jgi:hypothetical protein